jgi:hypothetical protein
VPAGGSVSASVGAKIVMNAVGAPAVGLYTLVAASAAPVVTASVNGKPATGVIGPLVAGGDYTLLVYGPLATPQMSLIEDDNHRPERAEGARLRLVHGVADLTDTLSLTADFVPIASGTKQAEGSPYANLDSSVNATLIATTPGVVEPVCTASDKIFVAASTYSLFVVGNSKDANGNRQPAVCILRQDR